MNYIGSKKTLLPFINTVIRNEIGNISGKIFCDLFAGTGAVARFYKSEVKKIIANDIEFYSYILLCNYIWNDRTIVFSFGPINNLEEVEGFIYKNYSPAGGRLYFTEENARKIDAMRIYINNSLSKRNVGLYFFVLASLLESADKVANVASVYGAFLKKFKESALKPLIVEPAYFEKIDGENLVYMMDANALIKRVEGDILYLDPPYNGRQYGANYHLLNTIAQYKPFTPRGKTGLPKYYKSAYCRKKPAILAFHDLVKNARFEYIILSYNNEGIIPFDFIQKTMSDFGDYKVFSRSYKRFKAGKRDYKADKTTEYIHFLHKPTK